VYGWPKLFAQFGSMECRGVCHAGMIKFNISYSAGPQFTAGNTELMLYGKIVFNFKKKSDYVEIGSGCKINVLDRGEFVIGANTKIANFCNVTVFGKLEMGDVVRIAHRCQIMDSNYHYMLNMANMEVLQNFAPIKIGNYCWVGNSTTITGGAFIPNKVIVASNSLINKDLSFVQENSIIGGVPTRVLRTDVRRIDNVLLEKQLNLFFQKNPEKRSYTIDSAFSSDVCNIDFEDFVM
jgi:acetyltransferase-like isoleucine patch superfamily enzyme